MKITGIGLTRGVYINDILIFRNNEALKFEWGKGADATKLAAIVLEEHGQTEEDIKRYAEALGKHIFTSVPLRNFSIILDLNSWLIDADKNELKPSNIYLLDENLPIFKEIPVYAGKRIQ